MSIDNGDGIIDGWYMCTNWPHGLGDDQPPPQALPLF